MKLDNFIEEQLGDSILLEALRANKILNSYTKLRSLNVLTTLNDIVRNKFIKMDVELNKRKKADPSVTITKLFEMKFILNKESTLFQIPEDYDFLDIDRETRAGDPPEKRKELIRKGQILLSFVLRLASKVSEIEENSTKRPISSEYPIADFSRRLMLDPTINANVEEVRGKTKDAVAAAAKKEKEESIFTKIKKAIHQATA